jgi:hypothetical protein
MSECRPTFVERCAAGEESRAGEGISDAIEEWHDGKGNRGLHEFLGLTWDEYRNCAGDFSQLEAILATKVEAHSRRQARPESAAAKQVVVVHGAAGPEMDEFDTRSHAVAYAREQVLAGVPVSSIAYYERQPLEVSVGI